MAYDPTWPLFRSIDFGYAHPFVCLWLQVGPGDAVHVVGEYVAERVTAAKNAEEVKSLGGLHVIVSEPNELERVDRQLIGRCARQGDPGSARLFASAEDTLIAVHGPWLAAPIRRGAARGELSVDITPRLRVVQRLNERKQAAARFQLMKRDLARESLLSAIPGEL